VGKIFKNSFSMKKILIVEDDLHVRNTLEIVLRTSRYEVASASDGMEALELLGRSSSLPDLIILDLMMPVMDGLEFRAAQLRNERFSEIPVILLSAHDKFANLKERLKAFEFLNKPIELKDLLDVVDNFFFLREKNSELLPLSAAHQ
jgi:CheY-like chemotaxis protein